MQEKLRLLEKIHDNAVNRATTLERERCLGICQDELDDIYGDTSECEAARMVVRAIINKINKEG